MIYLDTHVVVWLYEGLTEKLSSYAVELIEKNDLFISPILQLELCYLNEIKKIHFSAHEIIHDLRKKIDLSICDAPFEAVINKATTLTWTRDPFDRIMVAQAIYNSAKFLTKDRIIREHFKMAAWD